MDSGGVCCRLFPAFGEPAVYGCRRSHVRPRPMVCPRACGALPSAGILYRRRDSGVYQSGSGDEIFRCRRKEMAGLHSGRHLRRRLVCVFMYHSAVVHRHLQTRRGAWSGGGVPLFRSVCQHPVRNTHHAHSRHRTRHGAHGRICGVLRQHRARHVVNLPWRGEGKTRGADEHRAT